tara:strand:+ start:9011 stop:10351 length:1341 start_codon:yes stop_codon:yes gene_type:complete
MARNRVIYQSEAVYVGPSPAISGFLTDKTALVPTGYLGHTNGDGGDFMRPLGGGTIGAEANQIKQLHRIQTCNYSFNIARTDINQFGELAAIDRVVMDTPTVSMDFSYILATMENELNLGLVIDGSTSCISGLLSKNSDEKNYFIKTVGEGRDAVGDEKLSVVGTADETQTVATIGIGNGFMTSYTTECSVGNFPTCSVNVEGLNMTFSQGVSGGSPAIVPESGVRLDSYKYTLPIATGSASTGILATSALRPGDITFSFKKSDAEGSTLVDALDGVAENTYDSPGAQLGDMTTRAHAKIQSYNISLDMGREPIQRLGSRYAFTREITFPMTVSLSIDALVADLTTGSLSDVINCDDSYDIQINLLRPTNCAGELGGPSQDIFAQYRLKNCKVNSQSFSSDIGSNKSVTMEFATQIGGPLQTNQGLFMSGISTDDFTMARDDSAQQ